MLITRFDPWKSRLCTCPEKFTVNPYTGCSHKCVYCYASSYIPNFFRCRPKKDFLRRLEKEASQLQGELISIANSSDPYSHLERTQELTRGCLRILSRKRCRIQIVTKSTIVIRDIDILRNCESMVSMSVTTESDDVARRLEPFAPPSSERLGALETLVKNRIPSSVRIDPLIPYLNDEPGRLIHKLALIGISHITCSTYKVKADNWKRFSHVFPELSRDLQPLYFEEGERIGGNFYLPRRLRRRLIKTVKELAENEGIEFSSCREGFPDLNSTSCDGSWMIST